MKSTEQKLILISFVLAIIASIVVFIYLKSLKKPEEELEKTIILVAAETIPPRTLIDRKMIKEVEVLDDPIFSEYIGDIESIIGKYSKETILKNEGFHKEKLINEGEEELILKIGNNHRAVSINVTGDSGISYLLKPGDFVDIIAYLSEKREGSEIVRPDMTKVIMQNVEVLAVDKLINRDDNLNESEPIPNNFLITLSVPVDETEKIILAESIGSLKLALRSFKDYKTNQTDGATWQELTINVEDNSLSKNTSSSNESDKYKNYISYVVKRGDTVMSISREFFGNSESYRKIIEANNLKDQNLIKVGQVIKIPVLEQ